MRVQSVSLLVLAAILAGAEASVATSHVNAPLVDQNDAPVERLLRSVDDEERGIISNIANFFKGKSNAAPMLTNIQRDDPAVAKLVAKRLTLKGAYKSLNLHKLESAEELFSSPNFQTFYRYMVYSNTKGLNEASDMASFFVKKLGDEDAAKFFAKAVASEKPNVERMGQQLEYQLLRQWGKAGKDIDEVVSILPSLKSKYTKVLDDLAADAKRKADALAKAEAAAKAKAAAAAKPITAPTKPRIESDDPEVAKLVGKTLPDAFESLKLNEIKAVDDLFSSQDYQTFYRFMIYSNTKGLNEASSVPSFFTKRLGDEKAAKLFVKAAASENSSVKDMGVSYVYQLLRQWRKEGKTLTQVQGFSPALKDNYAAVLNKAAK